MISCSHYVTQVGKLVSHDNVVSRALEGSFRKRERRTGEEKGRCRRESGRFREEKRCSLDSFAVWAFAAPGCNRSNFVFVRKCNGRVSV